MTVKNLVAPALQSRKMTRYRFWRSTGLARVTAYRLVNDPSYVPGGEVWDKVCRVLDCQPGVLLEYIPEEESHE
jgi:DNA-binding Xre family transcriptional regulator